MSGIAGIYSIEANDSFLQNIYHFNEYIAHRGRDTAAYYFKSNIALGYQGSSLDINDQPLISLDGHHAIVFDGLLFNFDEIKNYFFKKYPNQSIFLKTTSTAELLLELYALEGESIFAKLNGMFSMAIWDEKEKKLVILRDPIGIKPLYISHQDNYFCFASELKAFYQILPEISVDATAITYYLHLGFIPHTHTILSQVKKLPAAHYLIIKDGKYKLKKYHNFEIKKSNISYIEAKEQVRITIEKQVRGALSSDANMGIFLSGGIDSSLIASIAAKYQNRPLMAFTITQDDKSLDESIYASRIADYLGLQYTPLKIDIDFLTKNFEKILDNMDEPLADSSFLVTYAISQFASKKVEAVLSGDGGDELFLGYGMYRWAKRLNNPFIKSTKPLIAFAFKNIPIQRFRRWSQFFEIDNYVNSNIFSIENNYFTNWQLKELLIISNDLQLPFSTLDNKDPILQQAWFDFNYCLPDDLLVKIDRAGMANALEIRPPLLSAELADLAWSIPTNYKICNHELKFMLKDILADYLPRELFDRPKKGFAIPITEWCMNDLAPYIKSSLCNPKSNIFNFVNYQFVNKLLINFYEKNILYLSGRIWNLFVLNYYLEKHNL